MSRLAACSMVALWLLMTACASSSGRQSRFAEPNPLMAEEIRGRVAQLQYQHRDDLLQSLTWLAQAGEQAIPSLLDGLAHNDAKVRSSCAWVLGQIGDRRVIPDLQAVAADPNDTVRMEIARSLVLLGDVQQCPALIEALDSDKVQVRYLCHEALKSATGHDFGYDHLTDNLMARHKSVLAWREWWSQMAGDASYARSYARQYGLELAPAAQGGWPELTAPPAAPGGSGSEPMPAQEAPPEPSGQELPQEPVPPPSGEAPPSEPAPAPNGEAPPSEPAPAPSGEAPPSEPAPAPSGEAPPTEPAPAPSGDGSGTPPPSPAGTPAPHDSPPPVDPTKTGTTTPNR